jgi:5-methylcytosine-specific restriction endonuclease McrA
MGVRPPAGIQHLQERLQRRFSHLFFTFNHLSAMQVLVLNQDYQAVSLCDAQRAVILVLLKKADLVADVSERKMMTVKTAYPYPSIIRLRCYIQLPYQKISLTRQNLFRRDGFSCVYCGSGERLTMDHVIPRAQGGRTTWKNLVTACYRCNAKKGDLTPEQAGLQLHMSPFRPSFIMYLSRFSGRLQEDWKPYLLMS